jgi:ABC-type transporter Mla subunit MlaD
MGGFIEADTGAVLDVAGQLDPAPARAASAAATTARGLAPACGDPLPGCQAFNAAVVQVADQIIAFCDEVAAGIQGYASVAQESAGMYQTANDNGRDTFAVGRGLWASLS